MGALFKFVEGMAQVSGDRPLTGLRVRTIVIDISAGCATLIDVNELFPPGPGMDVIATMSGHSSKTHCTGTRADGPPLRCTA